MRAIEEIPPADLVPAKRRNLGNILLKEIEKGKNQDTNANIEARISQKEIKKEEKTTICRGLVMTKKKICRQRSCVRNKFRWQFFQIGFLSKRYRNGNTPSRSTN